MTLGKGALFGRLIAVSEYFQNVQMYLRTNRPGYDTFDAIFLYWHIAEAVATGVGCYLCTTGFKKNPTMLAQWLGHSQGLPPGRCTRSPDCWERVQDTFNSPN